jgi:two-component system response regulator YesN
MNVAIVEDERLERESIKLLLSRMPVDIKIVFETFNGEDAVRLFRIHRPRLVLMDIHLPRLSGIEAAKRIREMDEDVEIVILTAYDNFNYAQEAIRTKVFDYLLKPYSEDKLYDVISRVEEKLSLKEKEAEKDNIHRRILSEVNKYISRELLCFLEANKVLDDSSIEFISDYFHIKENGLRCLLLRLGGETIDEACWEKLRTRLENNLRPVLCWILGRDIALILREQPGYRGDLQERVISVIRADLSPEQRYGLICRSGERAENLQSLAESFRRLRENMAGGQEIKQLRSTSVLDMYGMELELYKAAIRRDWPQAERVLSHLAGKVDVMNNGNIVRNRAYFSYLWRQMDRYAYQATGRRKTIEDKATLDIKIEDAETTVQLIEIILPFLRHDIEALDLDNRDSSNKIIEKVKEYIAANLKEDLSLEWVSKKVGLSSFYLCKLFKKTENESFKNYIIKVRMEEAKRLFAVTDLKIYEVAAAVGYPNANYFSKVFKEYTGTPAKQFSRT